MKIRLFILGAVLFGAIGCSENPNLYKDSNQPVDKRVENLLGQMTLEEKVAQMCQYVGIKHMQNSGEASKPRRVGKESCSWLL